MTAKEKAKELVEKFKENGLLDKYMGIFSAKNCAKITVEEMINEHGSDGRLQSLKYWQEVKQEIELL